MRPRRRSALLAGAALLLACGQGAGFSTCFRRGVPPIAVPPVPAEIAAPRSGSPRAPLHLVLVSIDTLRADRLGVYGHDRPTSPRIDRLAAEGVVFERAYAHAPKTAPSHMSLMTGVHPDVHGVLNFVGTVDARLSPRIPTLAEILRSAGYRTAAVTGGGNVHRDLGFGRGFGAYEHSDGDAAAIFGRAVEQLDALAAPGAGGARAPFFLFVHTFQVHDPYLPPPAHRALFADPGYAGRIVGDAERLRALAGGEWRAQHKAFWAAVDARSRADLRHLHDLYDACIRFTDDELGRLLDRIDALGLAGETLVVVLSDHGEEFLEHGRFGHDALFEELLRVPLVVRVPDAERRGFRGRVREVVRLVDVLPTVLDLVGLPAPGHLEGRTLVPLLQGGEEAPRFVFAQNREIGSDALVAGGWKLVEERWKDLLFDLARDPAERRPLAGGDAVRESLHATLEQLRERALRWHALAPPDRAGPLDAITRRRLESLGYLGDEPAPAKPARPRTPAGGSPGAPSDRAAGQR
jgi:arylsulfatase A-like enzyme